MSRDRFIDPAGNRSEYGFDINHDEEEGQTKTRNIERTAPTAGTGLIKQQGDDSPLILRYTGKILKRAQLTEMIAWWVLSRDQTIYFKDFADNEYEVQITEFVPVRKRTVSNPRGKAGGNELYYYEYTIEMEVITVRSGDWAGVTP